MLLLWAKAGQCQSSYRTPSMREIVSESNFCSGGPHQLIVLERSKTILSMKSGSKLNFLGANCLEISSGALLLLTEKQTCQLKVLGLEIEELSDSLCFLDVSESHLELKVQAGPGCIVSFRDSISSRLETQQVTCNQQLVLDAVPSYTPEAGQILKQISHPKGIIIITQSPTSHFSSVEKDLMEEMKASSANVQLSIAQKLNKKNVHTK